MSKLIASRVRLVQRCIFLDIHSIVDQVFNRRVGRVLHSILDEEKSRAIESPCVARVHPALV